MQTVEIVSEPLLVSYVASGFSHDGVDPLLASLGEGDRDAAISLLHSES